jgi:hypothetical protein
MSDRVTPEELRRALNDLADRIERGDTKSATLRWILKGEDEEQEFTFPLETEEERTSALLAIRTILGQVH